MTIYDDIVLADSPAVYYPCTETTGTVLTDASGNGRNGTINGTVTLADTTEAAGRPWALDSHIKLAGGYLRLAPATGTGRWFAPATNGYTLEAWFFQRSVAVWARAFDFANAASTNDILVAPRNNNGLFAMLHGASSTVTGPVLPTSAWMHLAISVKPTGETTVYLNNAQWTSGTLIAPVDQDRQYLYVGKSAYSDPALNASVSRVAVYNTALTAEQIGTHYRAAFEPIRADAASDVTFIGGKLWQTGGTLTAQTSAVLTGPNAWLRGSAALSGQSGMTATNVHRNIIAVPTSFSAETKVSMRGGVPAPNDAFADAIDLTLDRETGYAASAVADVAFTATEPDEPLNWPPIVNSVWYTVTPPVDGWLEVDNNCGYSNIYTGTALADLELQGSVYHPMAADTTSQIQRYLTLGEPTAATPNSILTRTYNDGHYYPDDYYYKINNTGFFWINPVTTDVTVRFDTELSTSPDNEPDTILIVYKYVGASWQIVGLNDDEPGTYTSALEVDIEAGYYYAVCIATYDSQYNQGDHDVQEVTYLLRTTLVDGPALPYEPYRMEVTAGTPFYLQVGTAQGYGVPDATVNVRLLVPGDALEYPIALDPAEGGTATFDLNLTSSGQASNEPGSAIGDDPVTHSAWFRYVPTTDGLTQITLTGPSGWQGVIEAFDPDSMEPLAIGGSAGIDVICATDLPVLVRVRPAEGYGPEPITLTWTVGERPPAQPAGSDQAATVTLQETPASLIMNVGNAPAGSDVTFSITGAQYVPNVYATTIDDTGRVEVSVPIPELGVGTYSLVATTATGVVTQPFTVVNAGLDTTNDVIDEEAIPPALDGVTHHWRFIDELDPDINFEMPHNPSTWSSVSRPNWYDYAGTTAPDGQLLVWESAFRAFPIEFSGYLDNEALYNELLFWTKHSRRFWLIDHRNRAYLVTFTEFDARARIVPNKPWAHDYTVRAVVFQQETLLEED